MWHVISVISDLDYVSLNYEMQVVLIIFLQINLDNRFVNYNRSVCMLSVNGMDFWIREPFPFSPR